MFLPSLAGSDIVVIYALHLSCLEKKSALLRPSLVLWWFMIALVA